MLRLTLACGDYDRTRPLIDGTVRPLGIDLTCLPLTIEEIFFRMARALSGLDETASLRYMLPWLADDVALAQEVLGQDYWTYGLAGNEAALAAMTRYSREQGLIPRPYEPRELFVPEVLEETLI